MTCSSIPSRTMNILLISLVLLLGHQKSCSAETDWLATDGFELSSCGETEEIPGDIRTKVPWVAGVFVQTSASSPYRFFVTGTILGPSTILTVLGGAFGEPTADGRKYSVPAPRQHKVAAGLLSTDLNNQDEHTQIVEVSNIVPYPNHEPENKDYHLVIFQLKTPLNLSTPYVRGACIPLNSGFIEGEDYENSWTSFIRAGDFVGPNNEQGASRKELKGVHMLLDNNTVCEEEFRKRYRKSGENEIYCGRLAQGLRKGPVCPSYGTAAVGFNFGRWFMLGVLALHESGESWCRSDTTFFFSRIVKPWYWIWDFQGSPGNHFPCGDGVSIRIDQLCDQKTDCEDERDEDPIYCRGRRPCISPGRSFECGVYGPCLNDELVCDGRKDCPNGEDEDPNACPSSQQSVVTDKATEPLCPPLKVSEGSNVICRDKYGEEVFCGKELPPGSTAHHTCKLYYESTDESLRTCLENGTWDPPGNFKCTPECGTNDPSHLMPLISGGQVTTKKNNFPWHASIFRTDGRSYKYICGGSLIEKNIVVTAAHCIADSPDEPQTDRLRLILGANSSDYNAKLLGSPGAQIFQVVKAWIPPTYNPLNLGGDIALLKLDNNVKFGSKVRPICYLRASGKNVPSPGTLGKVPGYGLTEDGNISEYLRYASYPVVSTFECLSSLTNAPPISTFCAGYKNGTSVCQGDSGGGLVFPEQGFNGAVRYVLKGVVSRGDVVKSSRVCNALNYAVFTHVDAYEEWIRSTLRSGNF